MANHCNPRSIVSPAGGLSSRLYFRSINGSPLFSSAARAARLFLFYPAAAQDANSYFDGVPAAAGSGTGGIFFSFENIRERTYKGFSVFGGQNMDKEETVIETG
jgi:hypothetical protein